EARTARRHLGEVGVDELAADEHRRAELLAVPVDAAEPLALRGARAVRRAAHDRRSSTIRRILPTDRSMPSGSTTSTPTLTPIVAFTRPASARPASAPASEEIAGRRSTRT